ncbi:ABC transporter ATP-binding protein [Mangrovimicrobium sediminis]|uniref:ABC transporter ATP-binding protein n=1 Tax=Mangrovimicrobium sediminis TaxID=2562682 RepID=A0A4Z0M752_9GAMM|nr:ABC transporter ATP-binding protein [Haliea sp. SAOS-164]TGD75324.1 ABC transporter ATP-binding protein [Haliea sp. SAOS-164]
MLRIEGLGKRYPHPERPVEVFSDLALDVPRGQFVSLMGPSGEGKSTLLHLLGCLDRPSAGRYWLEGIEVSGLPEEALAAVRNRKIGFVFQSSHFVDYLDLRENVALPGFYGRDSDMRACYARAGQLLEDVGLGHRLHHRPAALSGGERQRAAVARALFNRPCLVLADEPTGNLDTENSRLLLTRLRELADSGITVVMVTHDEQAAGFADRVIDLAAGELRERNGALA